MHQCDASDTTQQIKTRSSAVTERLRDASCHWIFYWVTQDHRNDTHE